MHVNTMLLSSDDVSRTTTVTVVILWFSFCLLRSKASSDLHDSQTSSKSVWPTPTIHKDLNKNLRTGGKLESFQCAGIGPAADVYIDSGSLT